MTNKNNKSENKNKKNGSRNNRENTHNKHNKNSKNHANKKRFEFKKIEFPAHVCPKCGELIKDVCSALSDKTTGKPVHFDCIIESLKQNEDLKPSEEIIYIGAGNFAVVYFENPRFRKNFKIIKLIEWEDKNSVCEWKGEIAELASKV